MAAGGDLNLPAGFRFHPTDEELVYHYLCRKCASLPISVPIIAEIDLYKYDPWQLPSMALYGEKEWFFFSPRDRKYPNGSRPNRAASSGYWKATGADKPIGKPKTVGIKKALVFYTGKAPKGEKTDWIMHEYRLADVDRSARNKKSSLRLDDWVLCRIYNKKGFHIQPQKQGLPEWNYQIGDPVEESTPEFSFPEIKPVIPTIQSFPPQSTTELFHADSPDSIHQNRQESSSSEHIVLSPSEFSTDREVQSERKWGGEFTGSFFDTNMSLDSLPFSIFDDPKLEFPLVRQPSSDLLFYLQKPF